MARFGFQFGGQRRILPGAYARYDRKPRPGAPIGQTRTVAVIGEALGGVPGVPTRLAGPGDALAVFIGGDLLTAIDCVYSPSPDVPGARDVVGIRVNPATQSDADINATGPAKVAEMTSEQYGERTLGLRYKVEDGSSVATYPGVKKVTIEDQLNTPGEYEIFDDLGLGFTILYIGAGSAATMTITKTGVNATALATACTGATADNLSIDLTSKLFDTIGKVVAYIQETFPTKYTVVLAGVGGVASAKLDAAAGVDIKTGPAYHAREILDGVVDGINADSALVTVAKEALAVLTPVNVGWTALTGGGEGTTANSDWEAALDALTAEEDVRYIVVASGDLAVIADVTAHVNNAEVNENLFRQAFVGIDDEDDAADTLTAMVSAVGQVGSKRVSLCGPGVKIRTENGLESFSGWANAACQAGAKAGALIGESLTYKRINVPAMTFAFTRSQQEALINAGVSLVQTVPGIGQRIIRSLTTVSVETDYLYVAPEAIEAADEIMGRIREKAERAIGASGNYPAAEMLKEMTVSELVAAEREGLIAAGIDEEGNAVPAYLEPSVMIKNGVAEIEFQAMCAGTIYYVGVTGHFVTVGQAV